MIDKRILEKIIFVVSFEGQQKNFHFDYPDGYEIVVPRKVKSNGTFVSHQIPHHFKRSFYEKNVGETRAMSEDDAVHYRLLLGQKEHHLELYPSHRFCSPGAIIEEHRTGNGEDKKRFLDELRIRRMRDRQCHYQGHVRNQPDISALSTCYGLVGYIKTKDSWYMIEPIEGHDFTKEIEHPHVVYKKDPKDIKTNEISSCINFEDFNRTINKREYNEFIKKRALNNNNKQHDGRPMRYTVELLVVLDITLLHQKFDVENYVLTMFNIAASLFHDISLGFDMDLAIVRIIRLEVEENEDFQE
ncbi:A disintegrin and metalloproteinase with thrombospondin motifs 18-like [Vespa crabro]|uniref:A disintegrin and metalloproteinase with thrombospondin motifs 18-like n=1 Tax=Vespa crabro TaxID=7445 RepID=UPI001F027A67|nr:A disintegrin and metalloproteinase with thrombospondin motifs 18-like [Vespa crabro]